MKTFEDFGIVLRAGASGEVKCTCPQCEGQPRIAAALEVAVGVVAQARQQRPGGAAGDSVKSIRRAAFDWWHVLIDFGQRIVRMKAIKKALE